MVPFGGWDMPLQYTGVLEEHRACRDTRGRVRRVAPRHRRVRAAPARSTLLQWLLTNDLRKIEPGRAQYTHLLDPDDAHVVDDIIVWWVDAERFFVMPNASNTDELLGRVRRGPRARRRARSSSPTSRRRAPVLAVQGPEARALLATVSARRRRGAALRRSRRVGELVVAGTGYTGEDGVEIHVPAGRRARRCGTRSSRRASTPAGLGARDTLRLEAGLPLHGHELGPGITPLQAGLGWVVALGQGRLPRPRRRSRPSASGASPAGCAGIAIEGRRPAREGATGAASTARRSAPSRAATSRRCSGTRSRSAFVPPDVEPGAAVQVDVRGQLLDGRIVKPPFVAH